MRAPGTGIPVSRSEKPRVSHPHVTFGYGYRVPQIRPQTLIPSFDFALTKPILETLEIDVLKLAETSMHGNFKSKLEMADTNIEGQLVDLMSYTYACRKTKKRPLELQSSGRFRSMSKRRC